MCFNDKFKRQRSVQLLNSQECQAVIDTFQLKEIAETGLCSEPTIKRWIASGKLKSYKFGRSRKVAESDLNAYLAICKQ